MSTALKTETSNPTTSSSTSADALKKIVIRRLPPSMTKAPLPDYDYMYFVNADLSLGLFAFSRAYIYFKNFDDILSFKERFDNYVFLDSKSNEYPAVVEFAQYQRRYKNNSDNFQKKDSKCNTIEQDSDYIKFLENFDKPSGDTLPSCEANLEELEQRERDKLANGLTGSDATFAAPKVITPLLEYMRKKREEKKMLLKERDRDLKKRREEDRRNNKRYDNRDRERDRDRERERERDYGYSGASSSKNFNGSNSQRSHKSNKESLPSTSNINPSNVKILTKSSQTKNPSNNDSNKSSASNHHNTESKAASFGSKSSNDSNNANNSNNNYKDISNKPSSTKSNYNSYKNNNSGHNSSRNSNKESNYNEFSNDGASSSYTNNENKKANTDQNNSNNQQQNKKEGYESKDVSKSGVIKNKDRPSIEIYNPAARRQQKQQPPAK